MLRMRHITCQLLFFTSQCDAVAHILKIFKFLLKVAGKYIQQSTISKIRD